MSCSSNPTILTPRSEEGIDPGTKRKAAKRAAPKYTTTYLYIYPLKTVFPPFAKSETMRLMIVIITAAWPGGREGASWQICQPASQPANGFMTATFTIISVRSFTSKSIVVSSLETTERTFKNSNLFFLSKINEHLLLCRVRFPMFFYRHIVFRTTQGVCQVYR